MFKLIKELSSSWAYNSENNIMQYIIGSRCTYLKYLSQSNWAQTNVKNQITKMIKQQCSNFIRPRYGALYTPTLQETSPWIYGHLQYQKKIMTQLLCVFPNSKSCDILIPLDLHLIKHVKDFNVIIETTPIQQTSHCVLTLFYYHL